MHTDDFALSQDLDPLSRKHSYDLVAHIRVGPVEQLKNLMKNRYPAPEPSIRLGEFKTDITSANHNQVFGQAVKLKCLDIRQRGTFRKTRNRWNCCVSTEVQKDSLAYQRSRTPVVQRHFKSVGELELCFAENEFGCGGLKVLFQPKYNRWQ